jgi:hypothetical protein
VTERDVAERDVSERDVAAGRRASHATPIDPSLG